MKAKKIVSLLLAAAMTVSMAACGGSNQTSASKNNSNNAAGDAADEDATESGVSEETSEDEAEDLADIIPEETVTLDVFDQLANYSGEQIGWFGQIMLDKFNVKLNIIPDSDGVYETRIIFVRNDSLCLYRFCSNCDRKPRIVFEGRNLSDMLQYYNDLPHKYSMRSRICRRIFLRLTE